MAASARIFRHVKGELYTNYVICVLKNRIRVVIGRER